MKDLLLLKRKVETEGKTPNSVSIEHSLYYKYSINICFPEFLQSKQLHLFASKNMEKFQAISKKEETWENDLNFHKRKSS